MSGPPWTWNNSNLTATSARCFASDVYGHIIAGTIDGVYYSSESNPGEWTLSNFVSLDIIAVASTVDGTAMFAITSSQIKYSIDHGHTWNVMSGSGPSAGLTSICCNGTWDSGGYVNIVFTTGNGGSGQTYQTHTVQTSSPTWIPSSLTGISCSGVACNSSGTKYTLIVNDNSFIYDSDGSNIDNGIAIKLTSANSGLIQTIMMSTESTVRTELRICARPCCIEVAILSMSFVTRLSKSPRDCVSK